MNKKQLQERYNQENHIVPGQLRFSCATDGSGRFIILVISVLDDDITYLYVDKLFPTQLETARKIDIFECTVLADKHIQRAYWH